MSGIRITWWGWNPRRWRLYLVRRSQWGPFGEFLIGPIGFTWPTQRKRET